MLEGKVAVVTGASAGIGEGIAHALADGGARVLLVARRGDVLDRLCAAIGDRASGLALDVAEPDAAQAMLDAAVARFGRADILVNNAGVFRVGGLDTFDLAALEPMIALNYAAPVRASYVFARAMKAQGSGHIVNVSSIGANLSSATAGVYGGLKRALEIASDALRIELAGSGVRVGIIAPGSTDTGIFDHLPADRRAAATAGLTPLAPADVAAAVRFMVDQPLHANVPHLRLYASGQQH
ncbi:SDR family oxidoreductase [Sphingomonas sp. A2-49]|uniref:SDR family oxidoreductase n=1 Tax=Sphingomonas sp. A2-49 TaxID=1391375 RepID=UPI0021D13F4E|nr:SDR family oxidoreductase [Sphingomonas sp. A2-49]MCU6453104.1 SDR family oxidoreductase [Sphingomonas sp. A2-49]